MGVVAESILKIGSVYNVSLRVVLGQFLGTVFFYFEALEFKNFSKNIIFGIGICSFVPFLCVHMVFERYGKGPPRTTVYSN